jgi:hypothetical protein
VSDKQASTRVDRCWLLMAIRSRIVPIMGFPNRFAGAAIKARVQSSNFANFLLRLYETERPRAVMVAWDTLDVPTYRHRTFAS